MKLHLPKSLLTAVIAACMVPAAYAYTLNTGVNNVLQQNETINDTQQLDGNVEINGRGYEEKWGGYPNGYSLTLESGANVDITGTLKIESQLHMTIQDGATLTASGDLIIGHDEAEHPADLTMSGGDLSVASFRLQSNTKNTVTITGGTLTITGTKAITGEGQIDGLSSLSIGGTDDKIVTLKTVSSAVTFDYAPLQLGNVTIAEDNAQAITITNATLNGVIDNRAGADMLVLSGTNTLGSRFVTVSEGDYYNADGTETSGNGYLGATYTVDFGTQLTLAEDAAFVFGTHSLQNLTYNEAAGAYQVTYTDTNSYYVKVDTSYTGNLTSAANIIVSNGATLDTNGTAIEEKTIFLQEGSTLANTGGNVGNHLMQNSHIVLEGDAAVNAAGNMGIISRSYAVSNLELNGHTLTKTGAGTLTMINTDITAGTVAIQEGTVVLNSQGSQAVTPHGTIFDISANGTLTFQAFGGTAAAEVLSNAIGTGNIEIAGGITVTMAAGSATAFAGNLTVGSGATLQLASSNFNNGSTTSDMHVDLSGLSSLTLAGGTVRYRGSSTTLENMTVSASSTFNLYDMVAEHKFTINTMDLSSGATLDVTTAWKYGLNIGALTGEGDLKLSQTLTSYGSNPQNIDITVNKEYTGKILVEGNYQMLVTLSVDASANARVKGKNVDDHTTTIESLTLKDASSLALDTEEATAEGGRTFKLTTVTVAGEAAIGIDGYGLATIENLTNAADSGTGNLTLSGNAPTGQSSIFNLNGGDFEGTINVVQSNDNSDSNVALNLDHITANQNAATQNTAARDAVINLEAQNGSVALGIAADEVTVRGISGNTGDRGSILSGAQASGTGAFSGDGTTRTLIVDTAGGDYSTSATLGDKLNITKKGEGRQTFASAAPEAIEKVTIEGGSLAFAALAELSITDLVISSGAELHVGSTVQTAAEGANVFSGVRVTNSATLEGGSTLNGGLDLTSTQTLTVNRTGEGPITLEGGLILPAGGGITLSGDILGALASLGTGKSLELFTGVTSLTLGSDTYQLGSELAATAATDLTNYFNITNVEAGSYMLGYTGGGAVYIQSNIPEPATATLSLLALAALAARRRRK